MKLRQKIDPTKFLEHVKLCSGDVLFCTSEGDVINLKSTLSQLVFAVAAQDETVLNTAQIICKEDSDREILKTFIEVEW